MVSSLTVALTGAARGLGDDIMRRAEEKREMAREVLRQSARKEERALDRTLDREDTTTASDRSIDAAELLRNERVTSRGTARGIARSNREENRRFKLGDLAEQREHTAGLLTAEQEREDEQAKAARERKEKETKRLEGRADLKFDRNSERFTDKVWRLDKGGKTETLYGLNPDTKEMEVVKNPGGKPFSRPVESKGKGGKQPGAPDSNAIRGAVSAFFGGFYDPISGQFSGLDKDTARRVLQISARAEEILLAARARGENMLHSTASNLAMEEAEAAEAAEDDNPLGLKR